MLIEYNCSIFLVVVDRVQNISGAIREFVMPIIFLMSRVSKSIFFIVYFLSGMAVLDAGYIIQSEKWAEKIGHQKPPHM
jgi:hypothetical protein